MRYTFIIIIFGMMLPVTGCGNIGKSSGYETISEDGVYYSLTVLQRGGEFPIRVEYSDVVDVAINKETGFVRFLSDGDHTVIRLGSTATFFMDESGKVGAD